MASGKGIGKDGNEDTWKEEDNGIDEVIGKEVDYSDTV